ncbi:MAG: sulfotransferase [Bacteroidota bacterium]|nr:sulfotransferase [Bacteroidota bacterium]
MNSKVLVIVGMHRSGTSVVTQWLHRCGLFIGDKLEGPNIGNVEGHFEDVDFLKMHQKLLLKRNFPSTGFIYKPLPRLSGEEKEELQTIIETKSRQNEEWGWKEPRTCLFLDEYSRLIPSAFYVMVVRDFNSTVSSLITREYKINDRRFRSRKGLSRIKWILFKRKNLEKMFQKEAERFLKIWIHYYEQILACTRALPDGRFMFVDYSRLFRNDEDYFLRLKKEWQFSLDYFPFITLYKEELLSEVKDISKYVKDKDLLVKARMIEKDILLNYLERA